MRYKILEADSRHKLEEMVAQDIAAGWTPCGGVAVCVAARYDDTGEDFYTYAQAVIHLGEP